MRRELEQRVGRVAARKLTNFAARAKAEAPMAVVRVILFGSRARGDATAESDWDVAVVVEDNGLRIAARKVFSSLALNDVVKGFHLSPMIVLSESGGDAVTWKVSKPLAREIQRDGIVIA